MGRTGNPGEIKPLYRSGFHGTMYRVLCTKVRTNYNSCTARSTENICSSSGGAEEKGKTG